MEKIYVLNKIHGKDDFQFYMQQFIEAYKKKGGRSLNPYSVVSLLKFIRDRRRQAQKKKEVIKPVYSSFSDVPKKNIHKGGSLCRIASVLGVFNTVFYPNRSLIVCSRAANLLENALPYRLGWQIVPMLWDCWPDTWEQVLHVMKVLKVRVAFVTSSQVAKIFNEKCPDIHFYFIPEGIDVAVYKPGSPLINRSFELYELGRLHEVFHQSVSQLSDSGVIKSHLYNKYTEKGALQSLVFSTFPDLIEGLSHTRIVVSFPQCDTNPEKAGSIDTLTQRYWESMLSGNLIVGRAPIELVDLIGYNPVVPADLNDPSGQICFLLSHMQDFQDLVDKNRRTAIQLGSWISRMDSVKSILNQEGYQ